MPKIFSSLCPLSAYKLQDNAICASVLLGLLKKVYFLEDFLKIFLGPPVPFFQKMRVLNELAKIPITCPFGNFWSSCLNQNVLPSLHFKCVLLRRYCHLRQCAFGPFKRRLLFGRFLKNFFWSPLCTFSENAGFG